MKIKATLFAVLALVVLTGVHNPVGIPDAFAQSTTRQVDGDEARRAINTARQQNRITVDQAQKLTDAVNTQRAFVPVDAQGALVLGQDLGAAGLLGSGFSGAQVAVAAFIVGGLAVLVSDNGTSTAATTGTTGTR